MKKFLGLITVLFIAGALSVLPASLAFGSDQGTTASVTIITQDGISTIAETIATADSQITVISENLSSDIRSSSSLQTTDIISSAISTATLAVSNATSAIESSKSALVDAQAKILISDGATVTAEQKTADLNQAQSNLASATQDLISASNSTSLQQVVVSTDITNVSLAQQAVTLSQQSVQGLTATVYNDYGNNNSPPLGAGTIVKNTTVTQISFDWGSGSVLGGPADDVQVKFSGYLTSSTSGNVSFYAPADDGVKLFINNNLIINDWYDKGGGGTISAPVQLSANIPVPIVLWYYENGGGANVSLNWTTSNGWQVVPATALSIGATNQNSLDVLNSANNTLTMDQAQLLILQSQQDVIKQIVIDKQTSVDIAQTALSDAQANAATVLTDATNATQTAIELSNIATIAVLNAGNSVDNLSTVLAQQSAAEESARQAAIAAEQARVAQEQARIATEQAVAAEAAYQAALAEQARLEAEAALLAEAKAEAQAQAAAQAAADKAAVDALAAKQAEEEAAAKALADKQAADAAAQAAVDAQTKADAEAKLAEQKAAEELAVKQAADLATQKAAEQAALDKAAADKIASDKAAADQAAADALAAQKAKDTFDKQPEAVQAAIQQFDARAAQNDTGILPYTVADAVTEVQAEQFAQALSDPGAAVAALGQQAQAAVEFVGKLFTDPGAAVGAIMNNVSKAGLDMTDDQRNKAQEVIVPVVIVSNIVGSIIGRIK